MTTKIQVAAGEPTATISPNASIVKWTDLLATTFDAHDILNQVVHAISNTGIITTSKLNMICS